MLQIVRHPANLILVAANLVPLIGVIFWGWDAFVLLMLYWLETAVIAFWTIARIAMLPAEAIGELKLEGADKKPFSSVGTAAFFTAHAGIFMGVHFLFLWALFSEGWSQRIHGVRDFIDLMVIGTGLWVPLLALFVGRGALMLFDAMRPRLLRLFGIVPRDRPERALLSPGESLLLGLYLRIVVMQVTIIIGAWFALLVGNAGALAFLIVVKTAVDLSLQRLANFVHDAMRRARAEEAKQSQA